VRSVEAMLRRNPEPQRPFASVLGCSDSRAPAELVFDQGLGDLFVIRVAGNIVAPSLAGSVEFAAEHFGTRLVVVMGHTHCGAIDATIASVLGMGGPTSNNLRSIVERVRPSIVGLVRSEMAKDPERLRLEAMRANVRASVNQLLHSSELLEGLVAKEGLRVVGVALDLGTGQVHLVDGAGGL
jgi:carbonic anhydrase